jgi:hypothetical protein
MDVMNVEQAKIAEEAGACAVMALGECRISDLYCSIGCGSVARCNMRGDAMPNGSNTLDLGANGQSVSLPTFAGTAVLPVW